MTASEPLENIAASEPEKRIQASMVKLSWRLMKCLMIWACVSSLSLFVFEAFRSAAIMAALALLWAGCIVLFQRGHHRTARLASLLSLSLVLLIAVILNHPDLDLHNLFVAVAGLSFAALSWRIDRDWIIFLSFFRSASMRAPLLLVVLGRPKPCLA